jgi:hypothetical protein
MGYPKSLASEEVGAACDAWCNVSLTVVHRLDPPSKSFVATSEKTWMQSQCSGSKTSTASRS